MGVEEQNSEIRDTAILTELFTDEGITANQDLPPGMQKPQQLLDASFKLFGFLPHDTDMRWQLIRMYQQIQEQTSFSDLNFENAMLATYLSTRPSRRSGYSTTVSDLNTRQLSRALHNLGSRNILLECFQNSSNEPLSDSVRFEFVLTDRVTNDPGRKTPMATPCPEALYQIRLFYRGNYLARVGFNAHREADLMVVSAVNLQGIPGGQPENELFAKEFGVSPFNAVTRRLKTLVQNSQNPCELRGLGNPRHKAAERLYQAVFAAEGVPIYSSSR